MNLLRYRGKFKKNDYKDNLGGPDEITSTTLCHSQYAVGAASVLIGFLLARMIVAADTPTATDSPSTTVPTQPNESESTISLNEEASQPAVENQRLLPQSSIKVNRHCLIVNCGYQILTV